jgi:hypothetical protein
LKPWKTFAERESIHRDLSGWTALHTALNSLVLEISMIVPVLSRWTGPLQLWVYDPVKIKRRPYAGNGREDIIDGALKRRRSLNPAEDGDGMNLYFADRLVCALRGGSL